MIKKIMHIAFSIFDYICARLRGIFWGLFATKVGKDFKMRTGSMILNRNVEIGDFSSIGRYSIIGDGGDLKIGSFVMIGSFCHIAPANHKFTDWERPMNMQGTSSKSTTIEDDVWIGSGVIVLPGVTIGKGAIVGAHALVTKDVKPYTIVGGVPAVFIRDRFDKDTAEKARKINFNKFKSYN